MASQTFVMPPDPERSTTERSTPCPCGRGVPFGRCCGPLVGRVREAATAEQLMRSRYTAFVLRDAEYLVHSWLPAVRPRRVTFAPDQEWTGLVVVATEAGGLLDATGIVEFVAHHRRDGVDGELHERSAFVRHDGRWVYAGADAAV